MENKNIDEDKSFINEKANILKKTAKEYFDSGEDEFRKERYNSSLILYFKSLIALVDLFILQKKRKYSFITYREV